jgi:transcriptional regulator with XRE-family HTH domain
LDESFGDRVAALRAAIAAAREAKGISIGEAAFELGVSFEWYRDIEWFDDEITDSISFETLLRLLDLVGLEPRQLFGATRLSALSFEQLAEKLRERAEASSLDELEEAVGWELAAPLVAPQEFARLPISGLDDIARTVGVDWRELLPS